jgi:hypothetical protein
MKILNFITIYNNSATPSTTLGAGKTLRIFRRGLTQIYADFLLATEATENTEKLSTQIPLYLLGLAYSTNLFRKASFVKSFVVVRRMPPAFF